MSRRILPSGEAALLVECDDLSEVIALHDALAAASVDGLVELVPAARTLLVAVDPVRLPLESAASWVRRAETTAAEAPPSGSSEHLVIPVVYDGADLSDVAALVGWSPDELVARHTAAIWRVAFIGFAPGFGYLVSDDWPCEVPRLAAPRTRVPAGAVGLAGAFSGVYPRESPGGWQLIGHTEFPLWDLAADPPARLAPGTRVRFERAAS
jgi:KipI family sensor histidine kinase inhibitor